MDDLLVAPLEVQHLMASAHEYVSRATGFDVDGTSDTLPAVDVYLAQVPRDRPELLDLVAAAVGCYFGEILRAEFGGAWLIEGPAPERWLLRLGVLPLTLFPVGIAYQAMARGQDGERYDDLLHVDPAQQDLLREVLGRIRVTEEEYYGLSGRYDTIEHVVDVLVAARQPPASPDPDPADDQ
jgi:hypothetical protein